MKSRVHPKYKTKYHVGNWPAYDRALVQRGDITVWLAPDAIATWEAVGVGKRSGQLQYSDLAIETALRRCCTNRDWPARCQPTGSPHLPMRYDGIDAPICQDTRSGGLDDLLASAEIGHDALVDLCRDGTAGRPSGGGARRRWRASQGVLGRAGGAGPACPSGSPCA